MNDEPDYDSIDAHLASAHKYIKMAHDQIDEIIKVKAAGLGAWADIHNRSGLAHGWAEHATSDLGRLEFLTKPPIRPTEDSLG